MASASDGADYGRSQTATTDSNNGVSLPSIEVQPGSPGSNRVQQPQAQRSGSNPESAAQTEGVQSNLSSQQRQEPSGIADPDVITDLQWEQANGAYHSDGEDPLPEQSDEESWEDTSEQDESSHPSPAPSIDEALDNIVNESSRDQSQATFAATVDRLNQRPKQQHQNAKDADGDDRMVGHTPAPDARHGTTARAPTPLHSRMDVDSEVQPTTEKPFEQQKVKCKTCKGRHVPPCNPDIVAANKAKKAQNQPATSSSKKRASEDADPQQPKQPKQPKRNRKADGLPWNWCYECQEEHPRPDPDGTTHHTKTADDAMRLRNEQRSRAAESARNTAAPAAQRPAQAPPQPPPQSAQPVLRALGQNEVAKQAYQIALQSMNNDSGRINTMLSLFDETRAMASSQMAAPSPVPASTGPAPYAHAATGLPQGTYNFPSLPRTTWPSQPPRGRGGGRGRGSGRGSGRGGRGGSAPSGQATAQNSAATVAPAANPAQATTTAPSAPNGAQTGQTGQIPRADPATRHGQGTRSTHHSAGPAGVRGGHGRGQSRGRGGSA